MPKRDITITHYALIEETDEYLILDCTTRSSLTALRRIRSWAEVRLDDNRFQETMLLSVSRSDLNRLLPLENLSNQWIAFHLSEYDGSTPIPQGGLVANFLSLSGGVDDIQNIQFLVTGAKPVTHQLGRLSLLAGFNNKKQDIVDALEAPTRGKGFPINVMVYDVGQGNANALVDERGRPRLFFDLGWPDSFNRKTRPLTPPDFFACERMCPGQIAPVILSHWDYDHWGYAVANTTYAVGKGAARMSFKPEAMLRPWIVPKPPRIKNGKGLGPTHMRFLATLQKKIAWPNTLRTVVFSAGIITRSDVKVLPTDRNNQALAWFVMGPGSNEAILLPGDLSFDRLRWPRPSLRIAGLVASHHAGKVSGITTTPMLKAAIPTKLAVSVGAGNKHGHPITSIVTDYQLANWHPVVPTSNRANCPYSGKPTGAILIQLTPSSGTPSFHCACITSGNLGPTQTI